MNHSRPILGFLNAHLRNSSHFPELEQEALRDLSGHSSADILKKAEAAFEELLTQKKKEARRWIWLWMGLGGGASAVPLADAFLDTALDEQMEQKLRRLYCVSAQEREPKLIEQHLNDERPRHSKSEIFKKLATKTFKHHLLPKIGKKLLLRRWASKWIPLIGLGYGAGKRAYEVRKSAKLLIDELEKKARDGFAEDLEKLREDSLFPKT